MSKAVVRITALIPNMIHDFVDMISSLIIPLPKANNRVSITPSMRMKYDV